MRLQFKRNALFPWAFFDFHWEMEKRRRNKTPNQSKRILFPQNFIHCCWILLYIARESEKKLYGTHILLTRIKECIRSIKLAHEICTDIRAINRSTHTHTHNEQPTDSMFNIHKYHKHNNYYRATTKMWKQNDTNRTWQ